MPLADLLLGRPLSTTEEQQQRIGAAQGVPTFGLDALSSAAYGPEAALTILLPLGMAGLHWIVPLSGAIIVLLAIVYFSYRQTIAAYPGGGGSYTVASQNLGARAGLLAGAALMIDYLLNVAVGISAGVGALVSAVPSLQPHTLALCLGILLILTVVNLRGVREPGVLFMIPTYVFVACLLTVIARGVIAAAMAGGHPQPAVMPPRLRATGEAVSLWLLLKAFSSGCTAMTGVEAVSNGVQAFQEPVVKAARRTLAIIIGLLIVLLAGIAWLARAYGIGATPPGQAGYQSVLSQLTAAVAGRGIFYYVTIGSILTVLSLSANTSFADFPRLCRAAAMDCYLPQSFATRGRRLVYSQGIWVLAFLAAILLIIFGGVTDRLIPLFAVGAFLAFTLSQAGMVAHWKRTGGRHARTSMVVNGVGALATGATVLVVLAAKFTEGAWVVAVIAVVLISLMSAIHRHYDRVAREVAPQAAFVTSDLKPPLVILPVDAWTAVSQKALHFAMMLSGDIEIVHVECEGSAPADKAWKEQIAEQARAAGRPAPKLTVLRSPYRLVIQPIIDHVLRRESEHPDRTVAVVLSELVERHWYDYFMHNQRGELLTALLLVKGRRRIAIVNVPWYLEA
ncbi:MAG TPA: APC family permease [Bryobacteraceae bacterium]|jgi:amino acid transporter|nr:APC family permease [Bryobacteraceae bacterium]